MSIYRKHSPTPKWKYITITTALRISDDGALRCNSACGSDPSGWSPTTISDSGAAINSIERPRHSHWYASARLRQKKRLLHLALRGIRRLSKVHEYIHDSRVSSGVGIEEESIAHKTDDRCYGSALLLGSGANNGYRPKLWVEK